MKSNHSLNETKQEITPDPLHLSKFLNNNSFFNIETLILKNFQLNAPSPLELEYKDLINHFPTGFLADYLIKDNEGIFCKNDEITKRQSGIFADLAKQVAKKIFSTGVISISLPVKAFEPRSMLERYTDWWSFAPVYLRKAGGQKDKIEAIKYSICYALSAMFLSVGQLKPFNPLLGETYEATFEDGTKIYLEHTSHIPCVSNYLVLDSEGLFKLHGYCDINLEGAVKMLFNNSVTMVQKGKNNIYLKGTNQTISFQYPKVLLGGMLYGTRYMLLNGHMKFEDKENNIKAIIYFNKSHPNLKNKRIHDIYGQIFYYDFSKNKKEPFFEDKPAKNALPADKKYVYAEITGSWLEDIFINGDIYMSAPCLCPLQIFPVKQPISSDARYREDLIWLKNSMKYYEYNKLYEEYAQSWKVALEIQQRHDRALREKMGKKK